jgi:hypothetical protein
MEELVCGASIFVSAKYIGVIRKLIIAMRKAEAKVMPRIILFLFVRIRRRSSRSNWPSSSPCCV